MQYERNDMDFSRGKFRIRGDTLEVQPAYDELALRIEFFGDDIEKITSVDPLTGEILNDLEMMVEAGYCSGVENYSRHLAGRPPGSSPSTLLDYFPKDFLLIIDESHITLPQIRGMFRGDRSRKQTLVDYGFRLPSPMDNRPLNFEEFQEGTNPVI